jgi:toxin ParE1/3/4
MNNVELLPAAFDEFQSALIWYSAKDPELGRQFDAAFQFGVEKIAQEPEIYFPLGKRHRFYRLHQFPYLLIYRILESGVITIVAVSHTSRKPGYWRRR